MTSTQKTNHLLRTELYPRAYLYRDLRNFFVFRFILSVYFFLELGLIFHVWVLNRILVLLVPSIRKFWSTPLSHPRVGVSLFQ